MIILGEEERIIEPTGEMKKAVMQILERSNINDIFVINLFCLNSHFGLIKNILKEAGTLKIFHGAIKEVFNNMLETLDLRGRKDVCYIGRWLNRNEEIVRAYWEYRLDGSRFPETMVRGEKI